MTKRDSEKQEQVRTAGAPKEKWGGREDLIKQKTEGGRETLGKRKGGGLVWDFWRKQAVSQIDRGCKTWGGGARNSARARKCEEL